MAPGDVSKIPFPRGTLELVTLLATIPTDSFVSSPTDRQVKPGIHTWFPTGMGDKMNAMRENVRPGRPGATAF